MLPQLKSQKKQDDNQSSDTSHVSEQQASYFKGLGDIAKLLEFEQNHQSDLIIKKFMGSAKLQRKYKKEGLSLKHLCKVIHSAYQSHRQIVKKIRVD